MPDDDAAPSASPAPPVPGRARRPQTAPPLSLARIEDAAFAMIEEEGLAELSVRKLAARLGVQPMSLYHHVPGKANLLDALVDRALEDFATLGPAHPWQDRLRHAAGRFRAIGLKRPAFFAYLAVHRLNTPNGLRMLDALIRIFHDAGFGAEAAARHFRLFGYYVVGGVLDETNGYARGPSAVDPPTEAEIAELYPAITAAAPWFRGDLIEPTFRIGVEMLIAGFERALAAPGPAYVAQPRSSD